jgi:hypothetical protein
MVHCIRSLWGYRSIYPRGSMWAALDKMAQFARKGCADLRTARQTMRSKQRLHDGQGNLVS